MLLGNTSKYDSQIKKRARESLRAGGVSSSRNDEEGSSGEEDEESFMAQDYRDEGDDDMGRQ